MQSTIARIRSVGPATLLLGMATIVASAGTAHAQGYYRYHGWNGGYYRSPPVVYGSPYRGRYYAPPPPPRYYYPPPVVYGPGVSFNFTIR